MICWTPANISCDSTAGTMKIVDHPDVTGESAEYMHHDLGCWEDATVCSDDEFIRWIMRVALRAATRDRLDPSEVHRALWELPEYRKEVGRVIEPPVADVVQLKSIDGQAKRK